MALSGTSVLYVLELVLYLLISPFALYLGFRHGRSGLLGYFYLNAACGVRIAADIVSLLPANRNGNQINISTAILTSIGLSPLLLALTGFLHEAHVRLTDITQTIKQSEKTRRWLWVIQFQIHGFAVLGMVLAIIGNIKAIPTNNVALTPNETHNDEKLRAAGAVILMVVWVFLVQYALYLIVLVRRVNYQTARSENIRKSVIWILAATPFLGLRCIISLLYTFDTKESDLNPITGALWVKVIFITIAFLGAICCLCVSGWTSRHVHREASKVGNAHSSEPEYEALGVEIKH